MSVVTPKTEAFVLADGQLAHGSGMSVKSEGGSCVASASATDGKKLCERRILLLHLTDAKNSGMKFENENGQMLLMNNGRLPRLILHGKAIIGLKVKTPKVTLYGRDAAGRRVETVPFKETDDGISFTAEIIRDGKAKHLLYEVTAE